MEHYFYTVVMSVMACFTTSWFRCNYQRQSLNYRMNTNFDETFEVAIYLANRKTACFPTRSGFGISLSRFDEFSYQSESSLYSMYLLQK